MTKPNGKTKRPYEGPRKREQVSVRFDQETIDFLDREALVLSAKPPYNDISLSDVVRYAVRLYRTHHGETPAAPPRSRCEVVEGAVGRMCIMCGGKALEGEKITCPDDGSAQ